MTDDSRGHGDGDADGDRFGSDRAEVDAGRLRAEFDALRSKVGHLEDTVDDLRKTVSRQEQYIERLEERLAAVDERTDLLAHVEQASAAAPEQRVAVYLQTLHTRATRADGRASLTVGEADSAVGGDIDRTTIYSDFQKAERLVDSKRLSYVRESRASDRNSRLVYDADAGGPVGMVAGHTVDVDHPASTGGGVER